MDLEVKKDSVGQIFAGIPSIDTKKVNTQVLVDNGDTIVLGGIFEQTTRTTVDKVPFLGDMPFVGLLFKRTDEAGRQDRAPDLRDAQDREGHADDPLSATSNPQKSPGPPGLFFRLSSSRGCKDPAWRAQHLPRGHDGRRQDHPRAGARAPAGPRVRRHRPGAGRAHRRAGRDHLRDRGRGGIPPARVRGARRARREATTSVDRHRAAASVLAEDNRSVMREPRHRRLPARAPGEPVGAHAPRHEPAAARHRRSARARSPQLLEAARAALPRGRPPDRGHRLPERLDAGRRACVAALRAASRGRRAMSATTLRVELGERSLPDPHRRGPHRRRRASTRRTCAGGAPRSSPTRPSRRSMPQRVEAALAARRRASLRDRAARRRGVQGLAAPRSRSSTRCSRRGPTARRVLVAAGRRRGRRHGRIRRGDLPARHRRTCRCRPRCSRRSIPRWAARPRSTIRSART